VLSFLLAFILTIPLLFPSNGQTINRQDRKLVSVIAQLTADNPALEKQIKALGGSVQEHWRFIRAARIEIPESNVQALAKVPGILGVERESVVNTTGRTNDTISFDINHVHNSYNFGVGTDRVWSKGITGKGVTIAVVDSGISTGGQNDFGGRVIKNVTFNENAQTPSDEFGHGTHVAGIIAGDGSKSRGRYVGIAPNANLINVKFSSDDGQANEGHLISSLEWIYNNHQKYNIRVVNISAAVKSIQSYKQSSVAAAAELLWKEGIVVVVAAGNLGTEVCSTCHAPANDPFVITVGALDDKNSPGTGDDYMKSWSSIGKTLDGHFKPEVVAPGSEMISYMPNGLLRKEGSGNTVAKEYFKMGGTSMAAPVVSGIVALMLEKHPDWTPDQVKWVLQNNTRKYSLKDEDTGERYEGDTVPGLTAADLAVFYSGTPLSANQGLEPHPSMVTTDENTVDFDHMAWTHMGWNHMGWNHMGWNFSFDK
jgi:serine protease AprX